MLTPMLWVVILSFKDNTALMADTSSAFTPPWTLANYRSIIGEGQVFTWLDEQRDRLARHDGGRAACCHRWRATASRGWSSRDAGCCS